MTSRKTSIRLTLGACLGFVALVLTMFIVSVTRPDAPSLEALREMGVILLDEPRDIQGVRLATHQGQAFTERDFKGHWSFVFFGFTMCPDICPRTMGLLGRMDEQLRDGTHGRLPEVFQGVFVSVDPERDDREKLARYVRGFSRYFVGLRESRNNVAEFAGQVNAAFGKVPTGGSYLIDHTTNLVVINPNGKLHAFIKPDRTPEELLAILKGLVASG